MPARAFFALVPPPAAQAQLGRLAGWCERRCGGRVVSSENLHLTLLFVGELVPGQVALLQRAASRVRSAPFEVTLERIEYWARPHLLCAVPAQPLSGAMALAEALRAAVREILALPVRPFVPHVTLLRRPRRLVEVAMAPLRWQATEFGLFHSERVGGGRRYRSLGVWSCA
ncbi:MAG: RNA 2',3'-cyclic phosphodiesterase [Immundisolibacter sp.]